MSLLPFLFSFDLLFFFPLHEAFDRAKNTLLTLTLLVSALIRTEQVQYVETKESWYPDEGEKQAFQLL